MLQSSDLAGSYRLSKEIPLGWLWAVADIRAILNRHDEGQRNGSGNVGDVTHIPVHSHQGSGRGSEALDMRVCADGRGFGDHQPFSSRRQVAGRH